LAADPRLATNVARLAERAWLIPALQEVLVTLPQDEIARRCERCNVSWAPVGQPGDLFTDPHLLATGGLIDVFISRFGGGKWQGGRPTALPVEFGTDRQRPGIRRQPPRVGEHNVQVLGEAGFTTAEIAGLADAGVIVEHRIQSQFFETMARVSARKPEADYRGE
jgi:crotonobetainyl-CoA:carnitine CoA-transferase CaiB-like acyl-CoA transferase